VKICEIRVLLILVRHFMLVSVDHLLVLFEDSVVAPLICLLFLLFRRLASAQQHSQNDGGENQNERLHGLFVSLTNQYLHDEGGGKLVRIQSQSGCQASSFFAADWI
jgi:hypothetical protein